MSQTNYIDILRRLNPAVYIQETDKSVYNITPYFNRLSLVVGCSKDGLFNMPVMCLSPENFEEIYGQHDYLLEKKGSYFHRTVKNMLQESPVICLNLRLTSEDDKYNWINISTTSTSKNSNKRSNPIIDFHNTADGFWKRDSESLNDLTKSLNTDNPISFVNMKSKKVSLLFYKTDIGKFDIPVEDWYNGEYPDYLHPKDYISDYMIEVIAVQGEWNDYATLSVDPKFSKYFTIDGIKKDMVEEFIKLSNINLLKRWVVSLIPYMKDKAGNDLYIESVINDDVNETGIMCSYDLDKVEDNSVINDLIGNNLITDRKPSIDFLSYKRYLSSFLVLEEKHLDSPDNSFGDPTYNLHGRTQIYSEGYVYNLSMKPIIISTTSSIEVKPFNIGTDAYGIINGKKVEIKETTDIIALHEHLYKGYHIPYVAVLTENGIEYRFGYKTKLIDNLYFPYVNYKTELVLGYYKIEQSLEDNYSTYFYPCVLDTNGFVNPFGYDIIKDNNQLYTETIYFKNTKDVNNQDFNNLRLNHLWYYLSNNLVEKTSIVIDKNHNKQIIKYVEQGIKDDDRYVKISVDSDYDIACTTGISYYMKDNEFLTKSEFWKYDKAPLEFSTSGIIGYDSFLHEAYLNGDINSGDPFFWSIGSENDVIFLYANYQNMILVSSSIVDKIGDMIVIENSKFNNGLFTVLNTTIYGDYYAIIVKEDVTEEKADYINIFDGDKPMIINLYTQYNKSYALVESWDGEPEELYLRLKEKNIDSFWAKTLEIEKIINTNKVIVDWSRYVDKIDIGDFLLTENGDKNLTRIVDIYRKSENELVVECNMPIKIKRFNDDMQTNIYKPIHKWITTLDFKVLEGFKPKSDVFPDGTEEKQNEILNLLNSKLGSSLASDKLSWRYLVDSFGNGLVENSKHQLVDLVEKKKFALGFINVPSIKQFRKDGTKYVDKGTFDTSKLLNGGDRKYNYGSSYSLANSSRAVYLSPYVSIFESKRYYNIPPASYIAQKYMKKFNDTNKNAWSVVAGKDFGEITNINGLEEIFSDDSLNDLNRFGITPLTTTNNYRFFLQNELTSYNIESSLKYIHNVEALIELEMSMYRMLKTKQWGVIDKTFMNNVKDNCDKICLYYKNKNAISDYNNEFVIDEYLTDNQIGYIKTDVELQGVMHTILLDISIFKTGGLFR